MLPILQLGPLAIQTPGLILLLGLWLSLTLAEKHAHRHGIPSEWLYNLAFTALLAGIVGARFAYAARYTSAFVASPVSLISLNPGLLDPVGGVAIGVIAALIYGQRKQLPLWPTLDALTPIFMGLAVALSLANLASGNGFGAETHLPWGIDLWGAKRHPAQIYETFAALLILIFLWPNRGALARRVTIPGTIFVLFFTLSAAARVFLEAFRGDSATLPNGWRIAQVLAWIVFAVGLWGLRKLTQSPQAITQSPP